MDVFRRGNDPERHRRGARRRAGHGGSNAGGSEGAGRGAHCAFARRRGAWRSGSGAYASYYGLSDAIVAPLSSDSADPTAPIAAALGDHVSALLRNDMKIGLGWGRTLNSSLEYLSERSLKGLSVVSLVGGVTHFVADNPAEFPSGFARAFNADCYLIPSPCARRQPSHQDGPDRAVRAQVCL